MGQSRHKEHKKSHGKAAESRIKEGGRQASQREIIRDQRRRHGQDPYEILNQRIAGSRVDTSDCSPQQERNGEAKRDTVNDIAVAFQRHRGDFPAFISVSFCIAGTASCSSLDGVAAHVK